MFFELDSRLIATYPILNISYIYLFIFKKYNKKFHNIYYIIILIFKNNLIYF